MALIADLKAAQGGGRDRRRSSPRPAGFQRKAQFYLDFVEAENSMGFHAPQEAARILGESIDFSRQGQIALRGWRKAGSRSAHDLPEHPVDEAPARGQPVDRLGPVAPTPHPDRGFRSCSR